MNDSEFENLMRGMKPAAPSLSLEGRIAASLPENVPLRRVSFFAWAAERLLWAGAGAAAMWVIVATVFPSFNPVRPVNAPSVVQAAPPASNMSEERLPWADEGVQMIGGQTPARLLRRTVVERHQSADGSTELRVPREDVILLPVSFR